MYYPSEDTEQYDPKVKKPFCNAFTGKNTLMLNTFIK